MLCTMSYKKIDKNIIIFIFNMEKQLSKNAQIPLAHSPHEKSAAITQTKKKEKIAASQVNHKNVFSWLISEYEQWVDSYF